MKEHYIHYLFYYYLLLCSFVYCMLGDRLEFYTLIKLFLLLGIQVQNGFMKSMNMILDTTQINFIDANIQ